MDVMGVVGGGIVSPFIFVCVSVDLLKIFWGYEFSIGPLSFQFFNWAIEFSIFQLGH